VFATRGVVRLIACGRLRVVSAVGLWYNVAEGIVAVQECDLYDNRGKLQEKFNSNTLLSPIK
jgi:hypothetical protein